MDVGLDCSTITNIPSNSRFRIRRFTHVPSAQTRSPSEPTPSSRFRVVHIPRPRGLSDISEVQIDEEMAAYLGKLARPRDLCTHPLTAAEDPLIDPFLQ
jgi:hypothetical protein